MSERQVDTRDGRTLRVVQAGDPDGVAIFRLHGTPGSGFISDEESTQARDRHVRLIAYDRPGYGGSSRLGGRNVADCAGDVRAIAGALGIRRAGVWGGSGGGPHSLACAALLGGLVVAAASLAAPAPYAAPGLDWSAGQGQANIDEIAAVREGEGPARRYMERERGEMLGTDPEQLRATLSTLLSPVDAATLTGEHARNLVAQLGVALAPGVDGWYDDDVALISDWGFGLSQIRIPVLLAHGRQDRFAPPAHTEWLAEAVPDAELWMFDDDGHLSLRVNHLGEALDWLLQRIG